MVCCSFGFCCCLCYFFFCKQKTGYEMRIIDWSSDVCSSDLMNDSFSWLDGAGILLFVVGSTVIVGGGAFAALWVADRVAPARLPGSRQIGRASCRERVCQ